MEKGYDEKDPLSIERYARKMLGKTFLEIWLDSEKELGPLSQRLQKKTGTDGYVHSHALKNYKGGMGNLEYAGEIYRSRSDALFLAEQLNRNN